ncbi:hypothetical protein ACLOJK_021551 [Asimina triloba]
MSATNFNSSQPLATHLSLPMASLSSFSTDFSLSSDFHELPYAVVDEAEFLVLPNVESFPIEDAGTDLDAMLSEGVDVAVPEFCSSAVPDGFANVGGAALPELEVNPCKMVEMQNPSNIGFRQATIYDHSKSDFWPVYYGGAGDVWEIRGSSAVQPKNGEPVLKVARYSVEERKDRILKYLKKRNQRNFNKTIKYACRKTLADRRRRVRGRFASNSESRREEEEFHKDGAPVKVKYLDIFAGVIRTTTQRTRFSVHKWSRSSFMRTEFFESHVKDNMEEWCEEALQSLMYLPITAG